MILGELIGHLLVLDPELPVRCANSEGVGDFASYRGIYKHLALESGSRPKTVEELLIEAENADGKAFEGYKGGEFTMTADSPIWLSDYGCTSDLALVNVVTKQGDQGQDLLVVLVGHNIGNYLDFF